MMVLGLGILIGIVLTILALWGIIRVVARELTEQDFRHAALMVRRRQVDEESRLVGIETVKEQS